MICSGPPISRVSFASYIRPYSSFYLLLYVHSFFVTSPILFFLHTFFFSSLRQKLCVRDTLWVVYAFFLNAFEQIYFNFFSGVFLSFNEENRVYLCIECLNTFNLPGFHYGSGTYDRKKKLKYEKSPAE